MIVQKAEQIQIFFISTLNALCICLIIFIKTDGGISNKEGSYKRSWDTHPRKAFKIGLKSRLGHEERRTERHWASKFAALLSFRKDEMKVDDKVKIKVKSKIFTS